MFIKLGKVSIETRGWMPQAVINDNAHKPYRFYRPDTY
jgi:hypothetical protein